MERPVQQQVNACEVHLNGECQCDHKTSSSSLSRFRSLSRSISWRLRRASLKSMQTRSSSCSSIAISHSSFSLRWRTKLDRNGRVVLAKRCYVDGDSVPERTRRLKGVYGVDEWVDGASNEDSHDRRNADTLQQSDSAKHVIEAAEYWRHRRESFDLCSLAEADFKPTNVTFQPVPIESNYFMASSNLLHTRSSSSRDVVRRHSRHHRRRISSKTSLHPIMQAHILNFDKGLNSNSSNDANDIRTPTLAARPLCHSCCRPGQGEDFQVEDFKARVRESATRRWTSF